MAPCLGAGRKDADPNANRTCQRKCCCEANVSVGSTPAAAARRTTFPAASAVSRIADQVDVQGMVVGLVHELTFAGFQPFLGSFASIVRVCVDEGAAYFIQNLIALEQHKSMRVP